MKDEIQSATDKAEDSFSRWENTKDEADVYTMRAYYIAIKHTQAEQIKQLENKLKDNNELIRMFENMCEVTSDEVIDYTKTKQRE